MNPHSRLVQCVAAGLVVLVLEACPRGEVARPRDAGVAAARPDDAPFVRRTREVMHTWVTISLPATLPATERERAFTESFAVFERIDERLNEWKPGSALSRVNEGAGGPAVEAPADVCEVVTAALEGAKKTNGLFDPTWAALRDVWRFGTDETGEVPSDAVLAAKCKLVGWRNVEVKPLEQPAPERACTIRLAKKGMRLGLGGVVKGWGVDEVVRLLRARGVKDFFVQAGGDLYLGGKNGERPWRAGIKNPRGEDSIASLDVSDAAFSTSGDYEHFFVKDGVRYHHLIDPRTCRPATASTSATVLAASALDAEFLTKATFILGPVEGEALAAKLGASVVIVTPDGELHASKGLSPRPTERALPRP